MQDALCPWLLSTPIISRENIEKNVSSVRPETTKYACTTSARLTRKLLMPIGYQMVRGKPGGGGGGMLKVDKNC
jgi:hypothetical protein